MFIVEESIQLETEAAVRSKLLKTWGRASSLAQDGMGSTNLSTG